MRTGRWSLRQIAAEETTLLDFRSLTNMIRDVYGHTRFDCRANIISGFDAAPER